MNISKGRMLKEKARHIRNEVIRIAMQNKAGHIAPSLSCLDILVALYYDVMSLRANEPEWESRDRLVFSKAHGCYALYAIMADLGMMPKEEWLDFYSGKSSLSGCVERRPNYGIESSCGSLGHGLPIAVGIAYGAKLQGKKYSVFCLVGDGELQEGSCWEAIQFAVKHELGNLVIIVDSNRLQAMDYLVDVLDKKIDASIDKLKGFGLKPLVCQGHEVIRLASCLRRVKSARPSEPKAVIALTTKGYGLKCMEGVAKFHFRIPTDEELTMGKSYGC